MAGRGNVSRRWRVVVATLVTVFGLSGSLFAAPPASAVVIRVVSQTFLSVDTPGTTTHRAGETLNLTAHVVTIGTASGTVFFRAGTAVIGSGLLVDGTAHLTWDADRIGTLALTASYSGNTATLPSKSAVSSWAVQKAPTQTPDGNFGIIEGTNVVAGQPVNIVAIVQGAIPADNATGKVVFRDGTRVLGTVLARDPNYYFMAHLVVSNLVPHTMSLTASYTGSKLLAPSTSAVQMITVSPAPVIASLHVSDLNPTLGESVTITQQMWPAGGSVIVPKGRVKFLSGTTVLGSRLLVNGVATLVTTRLPAGPVAVSSTYAGNARTLGITVPAATLPSGVFFEVDKTALYAGHQVRLIAVPQPTGLMNGEPTGTVTFRDGDTVIAEVPIVAGSGARIDVTMNDGGVRQLTASYSGDVTYGASVSSPVAVNVAPAVTGINLASSVNPSTPGSRPRFDVAMGSASSKPPTGLVEFRDDSRVIGTVPLSSCCVGVVASLALTTTWRVGDHPITAHYLGDADHAPSMSGVVHQIVRVPGTLYASGRNGGSLGDGTTVDRVSRIPIGSATNWASVSNGGGSTLAVAADGSLWGWGGNATGKLGDGTTTDRLAPVRIGSDSNWASVDVNSDYATFAVRTDGTLWAWGEDEYNALGNGPGPVPLVPVRIGAASNWVSVAASDTFRIALRSDGTVWSWGAGGGGNGVNDTRLTPQQVGNDSNWASIAARGGAAFGIRTDGTLWAWGFNGFGQLGDGTTTTREAPVQVGIATNWRSVAAGEGGSTLGIRTDGTLWAWGRNNKGQLGDGTTTTQLIPVQVGTDTDWASAAVGSATSFGIRTDGTLWAWGKGTDGQFGDGTTADRLVPVQVSSLPWASVSVGDSSVMAIQA